MADQLDIVVKEQGATDAATKIRSIASSALEAGRNVSELQRVLKNLKMGDGVVGSMQKTLKTAQDIVNAQSKITTSSTKLQGAQLKLEGQTARTALAQAKLATETAKTQTAMAATEAGLQRAIAAQNNAALSAAKLATEYGKVGIQSAQLSAAQSRAAQEVSKLAEANARAATAAQRLATEQQRTATAIQQTNAAMAMAAAAQSNAATASQRLSTEQQRTADAANRVAISQQGIAAATSRAAAAQTAAQTAASRLATEQQRTAVQTANAAAAADRAALSALRLAEAQRSAGTAATGAANGMGSFVRQALALAGAGMGAGEILKAADAYTTLQNKLQNVATSSTQVNELTERLFALANGTRTSIDATATSFARFDRALKYMGKSQEDTLRMTETVNKGLIVSGATAQEASAALLQLSQAFNAGKLQGDEFRSISENMPMVLDAVAQALGKPINQVKALSTQGKITAQVMYDAFKIMETRVDGIFDRMAPTMGQALVVVRNNWTKFIGELDKSLGVSRAIANTLISMSENMRGLAVAAVTLGAGLAVAFGPQILAAIGAVRGALLSTMVALAANPIGFAVVAITAAAAAVAVYGDEIYVTANKMSTLKDVFRTAWAFIGDGAKVAADTATKYWGQFTEWFSKENEGLGGAAAASFAKIAGYAKDWGNTLIGIYVGMFKALGLLWDKFPDFAKYALVKVVNFFSTAISQILNLWLDGLGLLAKGLAEFAPGVAASLNGVLDKLRIELPQIELGDKPQAAADELKNIFKKSLSEDYLGDAASAFGSRMAQISLQRRRAAGVRGKEGSSLRPAGEDTSGGAAADGKSAEKRAAALAKVNTQLDNELARMMQLQPAREAQAKFDAIEEKMIGKKITLTNEEIISIKNKIAAIASQLEVQKAYDAIYERSVAPMRNYNNELKAAKLLLDQGAISQTDYNKSVTMTAETYLNAVDPMRQYNKELAQQTQLLAMNPKDRDVASKVMERQNALLAQGIVMTQGETAALAENIAAQNERIAMSSAMDSIYNSTVGQMDTLIRQQDALTLSLQNGTISGEYFNNQMAQTNIAMADLQNTLGNGDVFSVFTAGVGQALQGFQTLAKSASDIIGNVMTTAVDGISNSIGAAIAKGDDLKASLAAVAQTIVTQMISALVKMGIQYLLNATMATATAATQTAASVAMAATVATAWAPAAAAVSLASFGANSPPAVAGIAAANTASISFASMAKGFQTGGYTGDAPVNKVAGVVHGQEYVVNAAAVRRIGVDNLEAMSQGYNNIGMSAMTGAGLSGSASAVKVTLQIINNAGVEVTASQTEDEEGNINMVAVIEKVSGSIAQKIRNRQGEVFEATKDAFNLQASMGPV